MAAELVDYHNTTLGTLHVLVSQVKCKPGWSFKLDRDQQTGGLCFVITVTGQDSSRPDKHIPKIVSHWHPVPLTTFGERAWRRWMFEKCRGVENHELGEWFRFGDERPYQPLHGPGENPYVVVETRAEVDALTTQDGSVREPYRG